MKIKNIIEIQHKFQLHLALLGKTKVLHFSVAHSVVVLVVIPPTLRGKSRSKDAVEGLQLRTQCIISLRSTSISTMLQEDRTSAVLSVTNPTTLETNFETSLSIAFCAIVCKSSAVCASIRNVSTFYGFAATHTPSLL